MKIRMCDATGDWQFGKGLSDYARDNDAVKENLRTRLLSWKNDCFFAMKDGIDYRELLGKGMQASLVLAVKTQILASEGITKLNDVVAELDANRILTITCNVDTIYGQGYTIIVT